MGSQPRRVDLRNFKSPILLLPGDDDINVDVQETGMEQIELFLREI